MNNTEVIFENIEERILQEIENARYAIFVSVAWFTNRRIFDKLCKKAQDNCYVSIMIQLDEVNNNSRIDYSRIAIGRSEYFIIPSGTELLHDKYCIIDFQKVITGSYNWTYKASQNHENIIILTDSSIASQYISRFEQLKQKYNESKSASNTLIEDSTDTNITVTPPAPTKKICPKCNKEQSLENNFCIDCGAQISDVPIINKVICEVCNFEQDLRFCDTQTIYCTNCGSKKLKYVNCYE